MLWIALAAQISAPLPTNLAQWFTDDDFPPYLIQQAPGAWVVGVRVTVGSDGKVQGCEVHSTSGVARLDDFTCKTIRRRAAFRPATLLGGAPAAGVYRTYVAYDVTKVPAPTSLINNADLNVTVASMPARVAEPAAVRVMFAVDADGRISSCGSEPTQPFERVSSHPALVTVACQQLSATFKPAPVRDAAGTPEPSVQDAIVRFEAQ